MIIVVIIITVMIVTILVMIIIIIIIIIVIIIIVIIHHSMLDLLKIEFHCFSIQGIFNLISQIIGLKSLSGSTFFLFFVLFL